MTSKLQNALNEQITAELWSANLYLSMSFYMKKEGYDGFAHWLKKQSEEENEHACTIADYMTKRDATPKVDKIDVVPQISNVLKLSTNTNAMYRNSSTTW